MPIELAALAATVVGSFLLPYAKAGIEKIAEGVTEKVGSAAAEKAVDATKKIWNRVKSVFSSEGEKFTLSQFEENPDAAKGMVEALLKKKLEQDGALAQELDQVVNQPSSDGKGTMAEIMNAGIAGILIVKNSDFTNAHNVRMAGVMFGSDNVPAVPKKDPTEGSK